MQGRDANPPVAAAVIIVAASSLAASINTAKPPNYLSPHKMLMVKDNLV